MKTLLKSGYEKILSLFYTDKNIQIHLRDIARKTKLNSNSAFRFLKDMEKQTILTSKKDGNLKKYSLAKNNVTYSLLTQSDILKFNNLPSIRRSAIASFLDVLKEKPIITLLFGSTAKNTYSQHSDIDMLLVVNKKIDLKDAISHVDAQTALRISAIQITFQELAEEIKLKNDKVIQSALYTGYPVTNHIAFYELMYNERI
jgi:predicted nucleotidyltransferase